MERSEWLPPPTATKRVSPVTKRMRSGVTPSSSAMTWAKLVSWPWPVDWVPTTTSTMPSGKIVACTRSCGAPTGDSM